MARPPPTAVRGPRSAAAAGDHRPQWKRAKRGEIHTSEKVQNEGEEERKSEGSGDIAPRLLSSRFIFMFLPADGDADCGSGLKLGLDRFVSSKRRGETQNINLIK